VLGNNSFLNPIMKPKVKKVIRKSKSTGKDKDKDKDKGKAR